MREAAAASIVRRLVKAAAAASEAIAKRIDRAIDDVMSAPQPIPVRVRSSRRR